LDEIRPGLGRNKLVVANSEIDRNVAEWIDLLGNEVLPLNPLVIGDGKMVGSKTDERPY